MSGAGEKKQRTAINPTRAENYAEWYQQVIKEADLAENSPARGCMVIKPWGYAIWENIQSILDGMFKATGHVNAYFPVFIPVSLMEKEAAHVEGFAKECAVVTHHRLEAGKDGKLVPAGRLEEPYIVRPTSETIIGEMYSKWIQSYRDLPILINQWANIVRWEMRTRLFLRTTEFLWQEGHTAHATYEEAWEETVKMLGVYADFVENYLAVPVYKGRKSENERFPGAVETLCIEAIMQDGKALQMGTSHFLGQNFAKASNIKFLSSTGKEEYAWTTSWGMSTRLIGGLIMTHSDDNGLIMPPRVAASHVVVIPVMHKPESKEKVLNYSRELAGKLKNISYEGKPLHVEIDERDIRGGEKVWGWVKKGVPLRIEIGEREIDAGSLSVCRRDMSTQDRQSMSESDFIGQCPAILASIQDNLFARAKKFRDESTVEVKSKDDFYSLFRDSGEGFDKFAVVSWAGDSEIEKKIKEDLNVTLRCLPMGEEHVTGKCIFTGKDGVKAIFGKSY